METPRARSAPRADASARRGVHGVEPRLVAQVAFTEWTRDGRLRHPSYQGLREDKPAKSVVREKAKSPPGEPAGTRARRSLPARRVASSREPATKDPAGAESIAGVRVTHPDRVLFSESGVTQRDLARYFESVADRILPHLAGRPLSLVRCPDGADKPCFFQKHVGPAFPSSVGRIEVREETGKGVEMPAVDALGALVGLVQIGALEIHPWGSRAPELEKPDVITIELDPGPGVAWGEGIAAAVRVRDVLRALELESFPKLTGGKGVHVVAPIVPQRSWDEVKAFARAVAQ